MRLFPSDSHPFLPAMLKCRRRGHLADLPLAIAALPGVPSLITVLRMASIGD